MRARSFRRIPASADVVWRVLTHHEGMSSWAPGVMVTIERRGTTDSDGVGAVRVVRMAGISIRELITQFEPDTRLGYRCVSGIPLRDYSGDVRLSPDGQFTDVTWELSAAVRSSALGGLLALYSRVFISALDRAVQREVRRAASAPSEGVSGTLEPAARRVS